MSEPGYPRRFGSYLLLGSWAAGGMGEILLARSGGLTGAHRLCLIKTLRGDVAREPDYAERFVDEARVVMKLSHAGISQVFDAGCIDGVHYLAMEFVQGLDLRLIVERLRQQGKALPEGMALWIACEVLEILDAAHRAVDAMTGEPLHLVHRDVSPHNVLVSFEGELKVIDFGLAMSTLKEVQTESHVVLGKVSYMAPEQARGDATDARADQFSAAVLAYELLTGDRFYGDSRSHEIWQVVGRGGFVPRRWDLLQPDVAAVLRRALAPHPDRRFPSCAACAEALRAILAARHPSVGRTALRALLEAECAEVMTTTRARIRAMAARADGVHDEPAPGLSPADPPPASVSGASPSAPPTHDAMSVRADTGPTIRTSVGERPPTRPASGAVVLAAAASLLGAAGLVVAVTLRAPSSTVPLPDPTVTAPTPTGSTTPEVPPSAPANATTTSTPATTSGEVPGSAPASTTTTAPVTDVAPAPVATPPPVTTPTSVPTTTPAPVGGTKPPRVELPRDRKLSQLLATKPGAFPCVDTLRNAQARGLAVDGLIDVCFDKVFGRR